MSTAVKVAHQVSSPMMIDPTELSHYKPQSHAGNKWSKNFDKRPHHVVPLLTTENLGFSCALAKTAWFLLLLTTIGNWMRDSQFWLFRSEMSLDEIRTALQDHSDVFQFDQVAEHLRCVLCLCFNRSEHAWSDACICVLFWKKEMQSSQNCRDVIQHINRRNSDSVLAMMTTP